MTAQKPFPYLYEAELHWPGDGPAVTSAGPRPVIATGPPPEFGGEEEWWSPEHLLLSALNNCLMATFAALARARSLGVLGYRSRATGTLDKTPGGLAFTALGLAVTLRTGADSMDRARETLLKAKQRCIVANALALPVELDVTVEAVDAAQPVAG